MSEYFTLSSNRDQIIKGVRWVELDSQYSRCVERIRELVNSMDEVASQRKFLPPDEVKSILQQTTDASGQSTFRIAVVGRDIDGKNAFVNALFGSPILPLAATPSICQMFELSHDENVSYQVCYYGDNCESITKEQLLSFAQWRDEVKTIRNIPIYRLDKHIEYIQIHAPLHNWPDESIHKSVFSVLPGLDSDSPLQEELIREQLSQADAILFVTGSRESLTQQQLAFLNQFEVMFPDNDNLIIVQTCFDADSKLQQTVTAQNQELLRTHVNPDKSWTIVLIESVTEALKTASLPIQDRHLPSSLCHFFNVIEKTLFQSQVNKLHTLVEVLNSYYHSVERTLLQIHQESNNYTSQPETIQSRIENLKSQLEQMAHTYEDGSSEKRKQFDKANEEIVQAIPNWYSLVVKNPSGELYAQNQEKILSLESFEQLEQYDKSYRAEVTSQFVQYRRLLVEYVCNQYYLAFSKAFGRVNSDIYIYPNNEQCRLFEKTLRLQKFVPKRIKNNQSQAFNNAMRSAKNVMIITGILFTGLANFAPMMGAESGQGLLSEWIIGGVIITILVGIVAFWNTIRSEKAKNLESQKQTLEKNLGKLLKSFTNFSIAGKTACEYDCQMFSKIMTENYNTLVRDKRMFIELEIDFLEKDCSNYLTQWQTFKAELEQLQEDESVILHPGWRRPR